MRITGKWLAVVVAAAAAVTMTTTAWTSSAAPLESKIIDLEYKVTGQPARTLLSISFETAVQNTGLIAEAPAGGIKVLSVTGRGDLKVAPTNSMPLDADITQFLTVTTATVSGTADIPAGTLVTLTNVTNGKTITLTGGPFSIPTGGLQNTGPCRHLGRAKFEIRIT